MIRSSLLVGLSLGVLGACASDPMVTTDPGPVSPGDGDAQVADGDHDGGSEPPDRDGGRMVVADAGGAAGPMPTSIARCTSATSGLSEARLAQLRAGGAPGDMRFLYPYDGTVFPRGLAAPLLMWQGSDAEAVDAVHVRIQSSWFEYEGCHAPDAAGRIALPQDVWDAAAAQTLGKSDPFRIELSVIRGDVVKGPISETLIIAPGSLKGSVFYNSYSSPLAQAQGAPGGAILRIPAGGEAEVFLGQNGCVGCHSVSAQGNRLVAASLDYPESQGVYALTPNSPVNPPPLRGNGLDHVGLSPDGSVFAVGGALYNTDTGVALTDSMLPTTAAQPTFSPDGAWLTFVDYDYSTGAPTLATMSWDPRNRTFGNYKSLAISAIDGNGVADYYFQWPTFLPDSKAIVFADNVTSDLHLVDTATGTITLLARAMGFTTAAAAANDDTYLPFGAQDLHQSFYPTVAPVAAGGYFWVFFDTSRRYGNVDTRKIEPQVEPPPPPVNNDPICAVLPFLCPAPEPVPPPPPTPAPVAVPSRQLWVTAIEISPDGSYTHDPSAPAFYLPGQEIGSNNHRAFAALDPCLADGASCESGTDCCNGFCTDGTCGVPEERCSKTEEACETVADCCDAKQECINGFCSVIPF